NLRFPQTTVRRCFDQDTSKSWICRNPSHLPPKRRHPPGLIHRIQLLQQLVAIVNQTAVWRIDKGEALDLSKLEVEHLENHRGQIGADNLSIGELRTVQEIG